jgi:hypothetical protein
MTITLGDAVLYLRSKDAGLDRGLKQADSKFKTFGRNLAAASGAVLAGFTMAAGAVAVVASGIKNLTDEAMNYGLMVGDFAGKMGIPAEEASRILQVADDFRISNEQLLVSFRFLQSKGIQPTLANLGDLADEYRAMEDPVERAQFLMKNFGARGGAEMARLLEPGKEALLEHAAAIGKGLVFTEAQVKASKDLYAAWDDLQDSAKATTITYGSALMPVLTGVLESFNRMLTALMTINETLDSGVPRWLAFPVAMMRLREEADLAERSLAKTGETATDSGGRIEGLTNQILTIPTHSDWTFRMHTPWSSEVTELATQLHIKPAAAFVMLTQAKVIRDIAASGVLTGDGTTKTRPGGISKNQAGGQGVLPGTGNAERPYLVSGQPGEVITVTPKSEVNYFLAANYAHQSERSLRDDIRVLELLRG